MKPLSSEVYGGVDEWVMERAAGRGTAVHNAIENWSLYGIGTSPPEYRGYFGFLAWVHDMKPEVLGKLPALPQGPQIRRYCRPSLHRLRGAVMVDVKTTSQLQEMLAGVQLEAYVKGLFASHSVQFDRKAILHLRRDGTYKYEPLSLRDGRLEGVRCAPDGSRLYAKFKNR